MRAGTVHLVLRRLCTCTPCPLLKCETHSIALAHRSYAMAEFLTRIDTSKLVTVETVSTGYARAHCNGDLDHCVLQALSALTAAFVAPSYNLPIFLFGLYAQEATEAVESLKMVRDPSMRIPQLNDLRLSFVYPVHVSCHWHHPT